MAVRPGVAAVAVAVSTLGAARAHADAAPRAAKDTHGAAAEPPNVVAARKHAERAHELYAQGSYREAIGELEEALKLDPSGKELVYNLGVVHEKLGDVDDALKYFRRYAAMDLTPEEREKTEAAVRRLEGAKREIEAKQEAERQRQLEQQRTTEPQPPPATPEQPQRGRVDALTITFGVLTGATLVAGIGFGLKALSDKPGANSFTTGQDGSYAMLQDRVNSAHREGVVADLSFALAGACGITTVLLYALRTKAPTQAPATAKTTVSAAPLPGGGALTIRGAF